MQHFYKIGIPDGRVNKGRKFILRGKLRQVLNDLEPTPPPLPRPVRYRLHHHRACEVPAAVQRAVPNADLYEGCLD